MYIHNDVQLTITGRCYCVIVICMCILLASDGSFADFYGKEAFAKEQLVARVAEMIGL